MPFELTLVANIYLFSHINFVLTKCSEFHLKAFKNFYIRFFASLEQLNEIVTATRTNKEDFKKNYLTH